jgi:serine/threonine-protein kinase
MSLHARRKDSVAGFFFFLGSRIGTAALYLAEDLKHHRLVAIKVLRPELAAAIGPEHFLREIEITARLDHPHILPLLDSGEAGGFLYYVMPYVEGESLRDRLQREKQVPIEDAIQIAREVADALDFAHRHDVVHRDIKPDNILLGAGHARVADFGIARAISAAGGDRLTETGFSVGTPAYMSPEHAGSQQPLDGRSDIYALGCVLYEMLAGQPPFTGPSVESVVRQHLAAEPPDVAVIRPAVPAGVANALQRALIKTPADRYGTAAGFVAALTVVPAAQPRPRYKASPRIVAGFVATAVGVSVVALLLRPAATSAVDENLVAVAPFEILGAEPGLELWREGLADLLSRQLDGQGPLRTVSPTVVLRRWEGRADLSTATELGHQTGAGLVLFGALVSMGRDSVRLEATLLNVSTGRALVRAERRDLADRMDRLADSVTVTLLRNLAPSRRIGAIRMISLGSSSPAALRAFLQGEQYLRRRAADSAAAYYQRALELDSTFTLALSQLSFARSGFAGISDSLALEYAVRAGMLNRGLAPRESLMVVIDSLWGAWRSARGSGLLLRRLFGTLDEAARRYPDDPRVVYRWSDFRLHYPFIAGITDEQALSGFDRAIELDSLWAFPYEHAFAVALSLNRPQVALRIEDALLRLTRPLPQRDSVIRLISLLLDPARGGVQEIDRVLESSSRPVLSVVARVLAVWPDSAETALRISRILAARDSRGSATATVTARRLEYHLALRGHFEEAYRVRKTYADRPLRDWWWAWLALLGAVPPDTAQAVFERWFEDESWRTLRAGLFPRASETRVGSVALAWWASREDTNSLRTAASLMEMNVHQSPGDAERRVALHLHELALAYLTLARGDTVGALQRFLAVPDSLQLCYACYAPVARLTTVRLLRARGRHQEAWQRVSGRLVEVRAPVVVLWTLERARLARQLGYPEAAIVSYSLVAKRWQHADPELQPLVQESRQALARLAQRPSRN